MDTKQLADFLRVRREALSPGDVGRRETRRRRTPGLRREEVAHLADISADYYTRMEQDRAPQPSPGVLPAITRALRLTLDERDHLSGSPGISRQTAYGRTTTLHRACWVSWTISPTSRLRS
ncbi:helix-turn-helix domain-containing protein [Streptomyces sp. NPDC089424]|uniref:helix-turn-helix domain-containing protein n=1 Tax=Streptomyces sp. NPDC089424 TaxID=3365917 RepID=UPI00381B2FE4